MKHAHKKLIAIALVVLMVVGLAAGCGGRNEGDGGSTSTEGGLVGSAIYKFDDTFMTGVRTEMTGQAEEKGLQLELVDSQNKQATQNEQVDTFITKGVNALAINPVDRTAAGPIIEKAKAKDLPIVFLNREPEEADMKSYDKVWYVGAKAEQSGTMSGEIIADYFKANKDADKNGDGVIDYVMIQGEAGHQDATLRTEYSVKALEDAGFKTNQLASDVANWDKAKATDLMKAFITGQGIDKIEAVLCNNDDMALGAIEALKAEGYNLSATDKAKYIPVVGVDATAPALEAMKDGSLLGTVLNDAENQGKATINVCAAAIAGDKIEESTIDYPVTDGKYVWIDYVKVTEDNYKDYLS